MMAQNNFQNNQTFPRSRLLPSQYYWQQSQSHYDDEPIFEDHSAYRVNHQPSEVENSNSRFQPQPSYSPYYSRSNHQHLPRSVSAYDYQYGNYNAQDRYRNEHPPQLHAHSMSLDSWQTEQLHLQYKRLAKLHSEIDLCRQDLVEIEHDALTKEEEYLTLLKVAKNPTKEDCVLLESEINQIGREVQALYNDCEKLNVDIPGDTPSKTPSESLFEVSSESHRITTVIPENGRNSLSVRYRPRQPFHDPVESPSRSLLLNPYDDSLAIPMSQW